VFSWIFLGGKCRYCKNKISPAYMVTEILTAVLFLLAFLKFGLTPYLAAALFLTALLVASSFIDLKHTIIPNGIVITGIAAGVLFMLFRIVPGNYVKFLPNAADAALGFLAGGVPLLLINLLSKLILKKEGMGGGDMKLMAMAGIFLGWKLVLLSLLLAVYLGGVTGLVIVLRKRFRQPTKQDAQQKGTGTYMPFGPFLAMGCYAAMTVGSDLIGWYAAMIGLG